MITRNEPALTCNQVRDLLRDPPDRIPRGTIPPGKLKLGDMPEYDKRKEKHGTSSK